MRPRVRWLTRWNSSSVWNALESEIASTQADLGTCRVEEEQIQPTLVGTRAELIATRENLPEAQASVIECTSSLADRALAVRDWRTESRLSDD